MCDSTVNIYIHFYSYSLTIMREQGPNAWHRQCNEDTRKEVETCIVEAKVAQLLDENADPDIDVRID